MNAEDYDAACDTEFGHQADAQAWSAGEAPPEPTLYAERHTWRTAARRAALVVGLGVVTAAAVFTAGSHASTHAAGTITTTVPTTTTTTPTVPTTTTPTCVMFPHRDGCSKPDGPCDPGGPCVYVTPPATVPEVPDAATVTADGVFLAALRQGGINVTNQAAAIAGAHHACDVMRARGWTQNDAARYMVASSSDGQAWDYGHALAAMWAAATAYCPDVTQ